MVKIITIVQSKHTQRHIMQLIGYLIAIRLNSSALLDNTNQALFFSCLLVHWNFFFILETAWWPSCRCGDD